jgi:hypothetical protein
VMLCELHLETDKIPDGMNACLARYTVPRLLQDDVRKSIRTADYIHEIHRLAIRDLRFRVKFIECLPNS